MYDKALALEILRQIQNAAQTVLKRFESIGSPDDFTSSDFDLNAEAIFEVCTQHMPILEKTVTQILQDISL